MTMFPSDYKLLTAADFDNFMFLGVNVTVWQKGIIDYGGTITEHTDEAVYINDDTI